ncbi:hypothetical protein GS425_16930 [Rhodococcus hoagii]|nr:hypothetical protein [Prescottella equi]
MTSTSVQPTSASGPDATPFRTVDPYTGRSIREYPYLVGEQLDEIVERAAPHSKCGATNPSNAVRTWARAAELVRERKDDLAARDAGDGQADHGGSRRGGPGGGDLRYYAEHGPRVLSPVSSTWTRAPPNS